ncbi:MAG: hypothetical protein NZM40_09125 [Sphingomonadaceae bacterium]|nr:hypothetical protein [Sphingomonadaceae bacterium]MDW8415170.1 hypothetical protein [Thermaurantiacus sp.]
MPRRAKGARPRFHDEPAIDRLVRICVGLASEVSVLADRLATLELLSGVGPDAVDRFVPDAAERARREARREALVARVFAALDDELDGLRRGAEDGDYWATVRRIEEGEV